MSCPRALPVTGRVPFHFGIKRGLPPSPLMPCPLPEAISMAGRLYPACALCPFVAHP